MKISVYLVFCFFLVGCSPAKIFPSGNDQAHPSRVYGFTKRSDAQLVVMNGAKEQSCTLKLFIDGQPAAELKPREHAIFWLTLGTPPNGTAY